VRRPEIVRRRIAINAERIDALTRGGQQRGAAYSAKTNDGEFTRSNFVALLEQAARSASYIAVVPYCIRRLE
jgi:hypothetical protein